MARKKPTPPQGVSIWGVVLWAAPLAVLLALMIGVEVLSWHTRACL